MFYKVKKQLYLLYKIPIRSLLNWTGAYTKSSIMKGLAPQKTRHLIGPSASHSESFFTILLVDRTEQFIGVRVVGNTDECPRIVDVGLHVLWTFIISCCQAQTDLVVLPENYAHTLVTISWSIK